LSIALSHSLFEVLLEVVGLSFIVSGFLAYYIVEGLQQQKILN